MTKRNLKKKTLIRLLVCGIILAAAPLRAWEWDYAEDHGTVEIIGIDIDEDVETKPAILVIPATLDGKPVTRIGDWALDRKSVV